MNKPILYFPPINKLGNIAFRTLCHDMGADFIFTEMIRIEKYLDGDEHQERKAFVPQSQRDFTIVQIICDEISHIEAGVRKLVLGNPNIFEINYNMGCPQSTLCSTESGGGILGNTKRVRDVGVSLVRVCETYGIKPSIKMRLGLSREDISVVRNIKALAEVGIKKIYVHGRVLGENYNKPATWEELAFVVKEFPELEIVVNGDVCDLESLNQILHITQSDSVLIGRAALEHPSVFKHLKEYKQVKYTQGYGLEVKLPELLAYLELALEYDISLSYVKQNIAYMTKGLIGGNKLRFALNNLTSIREVYDYVCSLKIS